MRKQELWSLDHTLAKLLLPYLIAFRKMKKYGYPSQITSKEWNQILDKMIYSMKMIKEDDLNSFKNQRKVQEGLDLFSKWFRHLWD